MKTSSSGGRQALSKVKTVRNLCPGDPLRQVSTVMHPLLLNTMIEESRCFIGLHTLGSKVGCHCTRKNRIQFEEASFCM